MGRSSPEIPRRKGRRAALGTVRGAGKSFDCMLPMLRAGSVEQLFEATRGFGLMDHNVVAGDIMAESDITFAPWCRRARAPMAGFRCPAGPESTSGMVWSAYSDMPSAIDPPGGKIVTANNRVVPGEREPYISTERCRRTGRGASCNGWITWTKPRRSRWRNRPRPGQYSWHRNPRPVASGASARGRLKPFTTLILGWNGEMRSDSGCRRLRMLRFELTKLAVKQIGLQKASKARSPTSRPDRAGKPVLGDAAAIVARQRRKPAGGRDMERLAAAGAIQRSPCMARRDLGRNAYANVETSVVGGISRIR